MARIFTTSFEFNHQSYDAIVTVIANKSDISFTIKVLDAELYNFLPNGEITFAGSKGFEQMQNLDNTIAQSLMRKIGDAIQEHLVNS